MIYTMKVGVNLHCDQAREPEKKVVVKLPRRNVIEEQIVNLEVDRRVSGDIDMKKEVLHNECVVPRSSRKGKRNWSASYIVRVFDWCETRRAESKLSLRALTRLACEF